MRRQLLEVRAQLLDGARAAQASSPEKKEARCFADSDPETRKVVYKALTTMAKFVVKPGHSHEIMEKLNEYAAFYWGAWSNSCTP